jgi:hypothetical protein
MVMKQKNMQNNSWQFLDDRNRQELEVLSTSESEELREIDREYLSWGDTVHYQENPIIISGCQGGLIFDDIGNH